jgi:hypothetical protein
MYIVGVLRWTRPTVASGRTGAIRRLFSDTENEVSRVLDVPPVSRALDGGLRGMEACLQQSNDSQARRLQGQRDRRREAREDAIAYVTLHFF